MTITLEDYRYDAERCIRCGGCRWVDHIYMPNVRFAYKCPSIAYFGFDSYAAYGRERLALYVMDDKIELTPSLLKAVYTCQLCGACDVGCKRNLDLEPLLVLEMFRARLVEKGLGPMPEQKKVAENISAKHNRFGSPHANRTKWLPQDIKPAAKADIIYFVGCNASYASTEIAQATARILADTKTDFMLLDSEEWCCGYPLYSTGQLDAFKKQMEHNIEAVKKSGASTVLVSCAEGYKTWKVDYPKILGKSTDDMGFKVMHIVEYVDQLLQEGKLKFKKELKMKATYHDPCNLGRLSEPWVQWEGTRGQWGRLDPPRDFRRGTYGVYQPPRNILQAIPGIELIELERTRENTWCCGAGGGVRDSFKEFNLWTAGEKMEEVSASGAEAIISACPQCKASFIDAVNARGDKIKVYDITEIITQAMSK
jgi:Fe-S oxidoreductase